MACLAQFGTATVLGTVKDATGAVVQGSKVTLENVKTGVTTRLKPMMPATSTLLALRSEPTA